MKIIEKLGDDGVEALLDIVNLANEKAKEDIIEIQTEKYERKLSEEISKLRTEDLAKLDKKITEIEVRLDKRITEEISKLRIEFNEKISKSYANTIKWMFIFWVGQIGVITAILFTFLKFIR